MIRVTQVVPFEKSRRVKFKESKLAHEYCVGEGIEIGASAHNAFNLPGAINVANEEGIEFYNQQQIELCGAYAEVDILADASSIPLPDHSQDYVLSSHMIEHHPNPIACFLEWQRVLKPGGIIFMIFPKRDALPSDRERPISPVEDIVQAYRDNVQPNGDQGHVYVYTLESMRQVVHEARQFGLHWTIVDHEESDTKVGNGHTLVYRQLEIPTPVVEEEPELVYVGSEEGFTEETTVVVFPGTESELPQEVVLGQKKPRGRKPKAKTNE